MGGKVGAEVVVAGGGNVAMDVAVTAKRLGAGKVTLVCLEPRGRLPASEEEIARAEQEGIVLMPSWGLSQVVELGGKVAGLELVRCLSPWDESGAFNPSYDESEKCIVNAENILMAVGQQVDLSFLGEKYSLELTKSGLIDVAEDSAMTSREGVFAGGDATTGPATVVRSVAGGCAAAYGVLHYLGVAPVPGTGALLGYFSNAASVRHAAKPGASAASGIVLSAIGDIDIPEPPDAPDTPGYVPGSGASGASEDSGAAGASDTSVAHVPELSALVDIDESRLSFDAGGRSIKNSMKLKERALAERRLDAEDSSSPTLAEAAAEAVRCLNCGCYAVCPSDAATALVALDATVVTNLSVMPVQDFIHLRMLGGTAIEPGEILLEIAVPAPADGELSSFVKMAYRKSIDFSVVSCAAAIGGPSPRICLGAVAPVPQRATAAERVAASGPIDEALAEAAGAAAVEGAEPFEDTRYKLQIAKTLVKRTLLALQQKR